MYLFLVRHFNDIDHLTPIVWKLQKDNYAVAVYCMNPRYDITQDYRLKFLKDIGVEVAYLHDAFDQHLGWWHDMLQSLLKKSFRIQRKIEANDRRKSVTGTKVLGKFAGLMGTFLYKLTRKVYYHQLWACSILERTGAQIVCFDYVMPSLYVVDALLKAAREMSIPALSLPHGIYLYTNEATKPKSTDTRRFAKFNRFDFIIAPNRLRKDLLINSGVAGQKINVLGSARYCNEWLEQNKNILPGQLGHNDNKPAKLKVVFMPSKPQLRMDMQRMIKTCGILAELDGVEALIKPHTRTRGHKDLFDSLPLTDVSHVLTAELCEWTDVLLVVGSSVITEALMRGKPALYLKYLHENTTLFEELEACWIIHNEIELKDALLSLQANPTGTPYTSEGVAEFLSEVVYGGDSGTDVLDTYEQFIVNCATKQQPARIK